MNKKQRTEKLKKLSAILTLFAMTSNKNALAEKMWQNNDEVYQEWGNPEYGDYLKTVYYNLPPAILDYLEKNKLHVVVLENENSVEKLYEELYHDTVQGEHAGLTIPYLMTSFVEGCQHKENYRKYERISNELNEKEFNKLVIRNILIHEIGHLIDLSTNFSFSENEEYKNIYQKEINNFMKTRTFLVDSMKSKDNISNEKEYFASIFACYINYPEDLQENCPLAYNYIDNIVNQIELNYKSQNM